MSDISSELTPPQRPSHTAPRFQTPRIIMALMLREMATTYGKSAGGYLWALLEPVLGVAMLSVIFSIAVRTPGLGTNFPLFYASGFLPFAMFNDISHKLAASIRFSRPFLAYPSVTFIDAMIARMLLNTMTHVAIIGVVLTGIFAFYSLPLTIDLSAIFMCMVMTSMLAIGVGTLNCYLTTAFPIWERVWNILTRPLFLMSGVFFLYGIMPHKAQQILWYNPLIHCVGMMRAGLYPTYAGEYISPGYVMGISLVVFLVGLVLLERSHRNLLER